MERPQFAVPLKNRLWSVGMFGPFLMSFAKTWERNIPTDSSPRCESPGSWCISYHLKQIEITMKHVSKSQSLKVSKSTVASAELREYNSTSIASCDIAPSWHSIVRGLKQHTNRSRPHEWPVEVDVPIVCTHLGHWRFFLRWNKMVIFHSCYISHYSWKGNYPIYYRWNIP